MEQNLLVKQIIESSEKLAAENARLQKVVEHFQKLIEDGKLTATESGSMEQENQKLRHENEILSEALNYMMGMYGGHIEKNDYDGEIEYSLNNYVINEAVYKIFNTAINIIDFWE